MATKARKPRPGLVLGIFLLCIALMYVIMAATQTWTPKMGLDLRGGMTITLTATNEKVPLESLELASNIIQQRVDGLGVGEASVATSGERNIIVSAPNIQRDDLVKLVGATAQLGFRPVLQVGAGQTDPDAGIGLPTAPVETPDGLPSAPSSQTPEASAEPSAEGSASAAQDEAESNAEGKLLSVSEVLAYTPSAAEMAEFESYKCGDETVDQLDKALISCDAAGTQKYLLGPVAIVGERVNNANSGIPQNDVSYVVTLDFDSEGTTRLTEMTSRLVSNPEPTNQFAIVLDGIVESAPRVNQPITGGQAQISGSFTAESAGALANVLRFGSLPLSFEPSQVESISPTLGGEQLRLGLLAGLVGLIIVVVYCFIYYRGLGLVVIGSLATAAVATYAAMVLMGELVGFAVNLPAIAGAVVSIGLTADSFVIYFERIRDEVREGRSLASALETGWVKARSTIIVADLVSVLSAVVLFALAEGGVKGFAFMLGLTTLIDLAICFWFTKPLVALLGRTKFFGQGHPLSGLDASHMGVSRESLLGRRSRRVRKTA